MSDDKNNSSDTIIDVETAEEKLGPELIDKIADKDWKVAPLPTEEELAKEKPKSPKSRNNINSRKNLTQYKTKKKKETKKKIVEGLEFKKKREKVNPFDYIELPENYGESRVIAFLSDRRALKSAEEETKYYIVFNEFLQGFDINELSSSDMEDIASLAMNRIIESRLLESAVSDPEILLDVSAAVEKYRKHSQKLKEQLSSRRSDRIDPRAKQNFSIVDIIYAYDDEKKREFEDRIRRLEEEKQNHIDSKNK